MPCPFSVKFPSLCFTFTVGVSFFFHFHFWPFFQNSGHGVVRPAFRFEMCRLASALSLRQFIYPLCIFSLSQFHRSRNCIILVGDVMLSSTYPHFVHFISSSVHFSACPLRFSFSITSLAFRSFSFFVLAHNLSLSLSFSLVVSTLFLSSFDSHDSKICRFSHFLDLETKEPGADFD